MGTDKALLPVDGTTLLQRTVTVLRSCCDDVRVHGWPRPGLDLDVPFIPDEVSDAGPLAGIATALRHAQHDRCVVVACDMPRLSASVLRAIVQVETDADVVVPWSPVVGRHGPDGSFSPLHAVYARRCLPIIERMLADGQRRVVDLYAAVTVHTLDEGWLLDHDPNREALMNVNDPEAWRAFEMRTRTGGEQ